MSDKPIPEFSGYCYNHSSYYCGCPRDLQAVIDQVRRDHREALDALARYDEGDQ